MKRLFFARGDLPGLRHDQLAQVRDMHRTYGLVIGLGALTEPVVHLDGRAPELTSELLRLAEIGAEAEAMVRAGVDGRVSDLVNDRDVLWKAAMP